MVVVCEKIPSDQSFIVSLVNESREKLNLPPLPEYNLNSSAATFLLSENDQSDDEAQSDKEESAKLSTDATTPIDDSLLQILIPEHIDVEEFIYQSQQRLQLMADYELGSKDNFVEQINPHYDLLSIMPTTENVSNFIDSVENVYMKDVSRSISSAIISGITTNLALNLELETGVISSDKNENVVKNRRSSIGTLQKTMSSDKNERTEKKRKSNIRWSQSSTKSNYKITSPASLSKPVLVNNPISSRSTVSSSLSQRNPRVRSRYMDHFDKYKTSKSTETKLGNQPSEITFLTKNGQESFRKDVDREKSTEKYASGVSIVNIQFLN